MYFPIVIHKDDESDYGVTVPDLPGCFSAGETVEEAMVEVVEAIELYLEDMLLEGEPIPIPSKINLHKNNPDYADGVWAIVAVDLSRISGESHRVNITMPERVLAQVDTFAAKNGATRSGLLAEAALAYIYAAQDL